MKEKVVSRSVLAMNVQLAFSHAVNEYLIVEIPTVVEDPGAYTPVSTHFALLAPFT